ncbi:MAG: phage tail protein I [Plectolyngbya sp. WJT66-NPBG17]|jgi:phage tail-like protein|nr:phage tail protein I [Plectolyngbya sp. WJT66-NPBG17]
MSDPKAWRDGVPFTGNLPEVYQESEVSGWLSGTWDRFLIELKARIDEVALRQLDPDTCDEQWLDYLAALSGFTGDYWDSTWTPATKRVLIRNGLNYLWRLRGTQQVLEFVLQLFLGDRFDVWQETEFLAEVSILDADLGEPEYRYFVRLPLELGSEFNLARKLNRLYGAAYCDSDVVYDGFYADFSCCGDPIFDEEDALL